MIKRIFTENKIGLLVIMIALGLIIYGQYSATRFFSGDGTTDWKPAGSEGSRGHSHRMYHK